MRNWSTLDRCNEIDDPKDSCNFVVAGAILTGLGLYEPLVKLAKNGGLRFHCQDLDILWQKEQWMARRKAFLGYWPEE